VPDGRVLQAGFRFGLVAGFFVAASFTDPLPSIGINISFRPACY